MRQDGRERLYQLLKNPELELPQTINYFAHYLGLAPKTVKNYLDLIRPQIEMSNDTITAILDRDAIMIDPPSSFTTNFPSAPPDAIRGEIYRSGKQKPHRPTPDS